MSSNESTPSTSPNGLKNHQIAGLVRHIANGLKSSYPYLPQSLRQSVSRLTTDYLRKEGLGPDLGPAFDPARDMLEETLHTPADELSPRVPKRL